MAAYCFFMEWIDTHTHIYEPAEGQDDADTCVRRALDAGVCKQILGGVDLSTIRPIRKICERYPGQLYPTVGLHPTEVKEDYVSVLDKVYSELSAWNAVAMPVPPQSRPVRGSAAVQHGSQSGSAQFADVAVAEALSGSASTADAPASVLSPSPAPQASAEGISSGAFRYVAVGEIGMDLYWDKAYARQQEDAFRIQLEWARSLDLPVVLHVRNAFEEAWHVLSKAQDGRLKGVFHCYSGSLEQSRRVLDLGFLFGIGGVLTFKNAKLPEIVRQLPLESLLLETDAPYLAPVPYRGKPNEGAYIPLIGRKLAECLDLPVSTVAEATTANALRLFRLS